MDFNQIFQGMKVYDVSVPLSEDMPVFPGHPRFKLQPSMRISKGDRANVSEFTITSHTGTHLDAPFHFEEEGETIDNVPIKKSCGAAKVLELSVSREITANDLKPYHISEGDRILFKTRNSSLWKKKVFSEDYVYLTPQAAQYLASVKVLLIGVDYHIPEALHDTERPVHHTLLGNNIVILEGLNLTGVPEGEYFLLCLPLRIEGGDAAPARVVLLESS